MDTALTSRLIGFIESIGIAVRAGPVAADSFMPGLRVHSGGIVYDPDRLAHPGDLLHEAGHIAVTDSAIRPMLATVSSDPGEEMAAIAWSYAALRAIGIDPAIVFHEDGYQGGGSVIAENFANGHYFGVPLLEWFGMAATAREAESTGVARFPDMQRWLR
ncbi:hypothetical protein [Sphingomonas sp. 28-63-12]|uniref:hypothetical protein n=1 Tax=Sphingomonas sp. 28-63-12 TaxID=1970434 RepID=UPI000BCC20B3|nr:MAG: hypothetical protein B7Y47_13505 [Sphingomonas sp. 28-63-12]